MKTKLLSAILLLIPLTVTCALPARAGVLRYFMHGGARQLSLGGASLLNTDTSDFAFGHPALETDRPDNDLRLTFEFEEIARTSEAGVSTSDVTARNAQRELVFTKRAPGRRFTLLAKTQDVNSSSSDMKHNTYLATHGSVDSASVGLRFGKFAVGAGRSEDSSDIAGFSNYLNTEVFDSNRPPDISAPVDQPDKFYEFAAFPRENLQFFYKKAHGERNATMFIGGTATATGAWLLTLPFALEGGGSSLGATAKIGDNWNLTFVNTRNSYAGGNSARLDYSNGAGHYDPFGLYTASADTRSSGFELAWDKSPATRLFFGASRENFYGVYNGRFVSVPTGEYKVFAYLKLHPTLYHIGYEKEGALYGITYRAGLQYGPMRPEGEAITVGTTCPLLIICQTTTVNVREMPYASLTQRALTMGFEYKIGGFALTYSVGQMFPKAVKIPGAHTTGGAVEGQGVQAKGKEGRGGMIQLFSLDYKF